MTALACAIPHCGRPSSGRFGGHELCSSHRARIDRNWEADRPDGAPLRDGNEMVTQLIEEARR